MDAVVVASNVHREGEPCCRCGRPRFTAMIPANVMPQYLSARPTPRDAHMEPFGVPLTVTWCLACDGGFTFNNREPVA